jgi:hypothetical protein
MIQSDENIVGIVFLHVKSENFLPTFYPLTLPSPQWGEGGGEVNFKYCLLELRKKVCYR